MSRLWCCTSDNLQVISHLSPSMVFIRAGDIFAINIKQPCSPPQVPAYRAAPPAPARALVQEVRSLILSASLARIYRE